MKKLWWIFVVMSVINISALTYAVISKTWFMIPPVIAEWVVVFISLNGLRKKQISSEKSEKTYSALNLLPASLSLLTLCLLGCKLLFASLNYRWLDMLITSMLFISVVINWYNVFKQ